MGARQHAHQRRLAGAVAADEGDHLAGVEVDADAVDGVDATERHADVAHLDERRRPPVAGVGHDRDRLAHARHRATIHLDRRRSHESMPTATTSTIPT